MRLLLMVLCLLAPARHLEAQTQVQERADSGARFPRVEGTNLENRDFVLPGGFGSARNLVFVAFRREQQADVDSWMPFLDEIALETRGVKRYEIPTLNRSYRMMRRFIDGGMARGIKDKAVREATITLYIDKAPFKRALQITSEDRIVAMLVARDGRILWRTEGPFTRAAGESFRAALELNQPTGP